MTSTTQCRLGLVLGFFLLFCSRSFASDLDTIGLTPLRAVDSTLNGSGIYVVQAEASTSATTNQFEVNPGAVGQPTSLFTWIGSSGSATTFPNNVGEESGHADTVAGHFYHVNDGPAQGVSHVDNYLGDTFYNNIVAANGSTLAKVVNQSFIFNSSSQDAAIETAYDNYVARHGTIFCSGTGGGSVVPAAASYNNIAVGVSDGQSSSGGTADGRAKPDLCAPGVATSFSTPYVSGASAILLQAAARGDGGTNLTAAGDVRTVKALLMNGAVKPSNWVHSASVPVDAIHGYGAGVLNIFNSWKQMTFGQRRPIETTSVATGAAHPPGSNPGDEPTIVGWDFGTVSTSSQDAVAHYYLNLPATNGNYTFTATLTWDRALNATGINDLDLYLYRASDGASIAVSTSRVDNVEHVYVPSLPAGRYDLQVLKNSGARSVSATETYALAFEGFTMPMSIAYQNGAVVISWPIYPDGFTLESTPNLNPPITWTPVGVMPVISNNLYRVTVNSPSGMSFYRLRR
jgi:hypothetical protein